LREKVDFLWRFRRSVVWWRWRHVRAVLTRRWRQECDGKETVVASAGPGDHFKELINLGGLDSWDQSRSRSRTSFVLRLTLENRRDYPSCQDHLFLSPLRFFKSRLFSRDLDVSKFLSRSLRQIETIEINRDNHAFLR
jgi:hypothetical protein